MSDPEKPRTRWIGRAARALGWTVLAVTGLVALLAGLVHLPPFQQSATRTAARAAGKALSSSIVAGSIRWNALEGTLELRNVSIRGEGERAGTEISVPRGRIALSVRDLLRGRVVVESAVFESPDVRFALDAQGRLLMPFVVPPSPDEESTQRPDVDVRNVRLTKGRFELVDRGEAARRVDVGGIALEGRVQLRDLASTGTLTLGTIDVGASGHEPLRGSSLTARWTTRDDALDFVARLEAKEAGLEGRLDAAVRELSGKPRYTATLTTSGTLGPLAARLLPDLGLGGRVEARVVASGKGSELPSATATVTAETLTLLGRTFERVDFAGDLAGALLRKGTLDVTSGPGRLHAEASGTVRPALKDLRFSARAQRVDLARLVVLPAGSGIAATLDGTASGTLARPAFEAISASAEVAVSASGRGARGALAPNARARLRLAGGVVTVETAELSERRTTASLQGVYDHRRSTFEGRLDADSSDIGPFLALLGFEGKGELSAHVSGGGTLSRPVLDGRFRARSLVVSGARIDCVELDAKAEGSRLSVTNGSVSAYDFSAGAEGEGVLPLPGVKSPRMDLRIRGVTFRGRLLPDVDANATLGATVEARLWTADGRLSATAVAPARGGTSAEATLVKFDLAPFAAALPAHLADFDGEVSGHFEASQPRSGPPAATASVEDGFVAVAGLRFSTSGARASIRGDRVVVEGLELRGGDGSLLRLSGRGTLDGSALEGSVRLEIPELSALAPLLPPTPKDETEEPLTGRLSADVKLAGSAQRPNFTGTIQARDLAAFGVALARLDATLKPAGEGEVAAAAELEGLSWGAYRLEDASVEGRLAGNAVTAEGSAFAGRLRLKATGSLAGARPFDATATLDALDLSPLLHAAGVPDDLTATTSGRVRVRGTVADPGGIAVDVDLDSLEATHPKWNARSEGPVRVVVDRSRLDIRSLRFSGAGLALEATGGLPFNGSGNDRISLTSSMDLSVLLPFVDSLDRASGRVSARLDVGGSLSKPLPTGSVTVEEALLDGPDFPTPIEKLTGTVEARPGEIRTDSVSARVGGGTVVLTGVLGVAEGRPRRVDASLRARDLELEAGKDLQVRAAADLTAKGEWSAVTVGGEVRIEDAVYMPALDLTGILKALKARRHHPGRTPNTEPSPFVPHLSLDVAILAKDAIHIEGNLGDVELGGILRVKGTPETPVVLGTISSTRGTIYLLGSTFELSRCHLEFSDPLAIDPEVDVVATTTKDDNEITLRLDGRASKIQLLLSSSKGQSQAEIVSVLLGGSGTGSSSELSAAAARMAMRGAASPILGSLGAHTDLEIVPLPTTPEGEEFLFSVGKDLGGGISATYYKGVSGETTDALEMKWRLSSRARGRLRQNQDGSISGGFRIRRDLD